MTNIEQAEITDEVDGLEPETALEAEPATAVDESKGEYVETDSEKVQARINKITAEKYAVKRRAEQAEQELAELKANTPQGTINSTAEPKLEDYDYDEQAFNNALIKHEVGLQSQEIAKEQRRIYDNQQAQQAQKQSQKQFDDNLSGFKAKTPDYETVIQSLPELPEHILGTILASGKPELAYHLAGHLDLVDSLLGLDPMQAAMQLGTISAQLSATTKTVKASDAPDPIEPINSGGSISDDKGVPGVTYT